MKQTTGCVISLLTVPVAIILRGWVLVVLWEWFVVPLFGLPTPTIPFAIGLVLVFGMLSPWNMNKDTDQDKMGEHYWIKGVVTALGTPILQLAIGWIVHQFV